MNPIGPADQELRCLPQLPSAVQSSTSRLSSSGSSGFIAAKHQRATYRRSSAPLTSRQCGIALSQNDRDTLVDVLATPTGSKTRRACAKGWRPAPSQGGADARAVE